jgi:hypothetical protein
MAILNAVWGPSYRAIITAMLWPTCKAIVSVVWGPSHRSIIMAK